MRSFLVAFAFVLMSGLFIVGCDSGPTRPGVQPESAPNVSSKAMGTHQTPATHPANFVAPLAGDEVVSPVDTDARGLAKLKLNKAGDELHYKLNVANIEDVIGAHIHRAPAGENGPIVGFLFGNPFAAPVTVNGGLAEGTLTAADVVGPLAGDFGALVEAMRAGNTYVQVHTLENVSGEIRGQLDRGSGVAR